MKTSKNYLFTGLIKWITAALFTGFSVNASAVEEPYINELKGKQVAADSFFTVSDEKFNTLSPTQWQLINHISADDILSFEINFDTSIYFYNQPFTCTLNFTIYIYGDQSDPDLITDATTHAGIDLVIRYDTVTGKPYKGIAMYKFKGAHKFKVKILSITCPQLNPVPAIFRLKGQIIVNRKYIFNDISTDLTRFSIINGNQLKLEWTPSLYPGAEMFDLEYTYIDKNSQVASSIAASESAGNYFPMVDSLSKWFKNNNTRITTTAASYLINMSYDSGFILFRIRGVQINYPNDLRWEGEWNYSARPVTSPCTTSCPVGVVKFDGHEQNLNWQFTISFAEEGKRKEVISYFDGSLRNRQSVTINNTDNKAIVQETIYDALGRPAANILPAPDVDSTIHYFRGFNKNKNGIPYSFSDLYFGPNCVTTADSVSYLSGAGRYYSTNNPFQNTYLNAKYIPNAGGYPLSVTEYMADNTGRIKRQGGVGTAFQPGFDHDTKYFYGKPTQTELDRLFGTEAGNASHYLKNMVQDANGQISVSYLDAGGKTIATALAGVASPNTHSLPSNGPGASVQVSNDLIQPGNFIRNPSENSLSASATFLAPVTGTYVFNYRVEPLVYQKLFGPDKDSVICSNCYYDLEITVKDDCEILVDSVIVVAGNVFDTSCANIPAPVQGVMNVTLNKIGEYYITYTLRISGDALNFYDSVHLEKNSDIKKLNYFLLEELKETDFYGCYSVCETCFDKLGTKPEFVSLFNSIYFADSLIFRTEDSLWVLSLYDSLYVNCQSLQADCGKNVCDEKLDLLKLDVSPGGQYALYDSAYQLLEQPINRLAMRNQVSFFTNESGARDSIDLYNEDGEDSVRVDVKSLNDAMFITYWKDVWADSLVRLHPEYCYYLWCVANESSFSFDHEIANWLDADTAMARGWFNPGDYKALLDQDPFFQPGGNGAALYNKMKKALQLFSRTYMRRAQPRKNILQYIDIVLYCKTQNNGWNTCNPDNACRSRNREWFLYNTLYLNLKLKFYEEARRMNPQFAACTNCHIGKDLIGEAGLECIVPPISDFEVKITSQGGEFNRIEWIYRGPLLQRAYDLILRIKYNDNNQCAPLPCPQPYKYLTFKPGDSSVIIDYSGILENRHELDSIYCAKSSSPFTDSACNNSCPGGIYDPYDEDFVSYYVEHGNRDTLPSGAPPGYGNCQFYPEFNLFTGPDSSCCFLNVWVCVYDSTCCSPPQGMVGWWPLDETSGAVVHDIAGSVYDNGTPQLAPISIFGGPSSKPAVVSTGLSFPAGISPTPGPNVYVEVPSNLEVNFGTSDFTIDAWIKLGPTAGNIYPIVDKIGFNSGYALFVQGGQLLIRLGPDNFGGLVAAVSNFAPPAIVLGPWYHVVVTVKRVSPKPLVTFYINGVSNGPIPTAGPNMNAGNNINNTTPLWIGGNSRLASGGAIVNRGEIAIDELEFFHRELNQNEIMRIFNADSAGKCKCASPPQGMVGWWPLDEQVGDTVVKDIFVGHNGTPNPGGQIGNNPNFGPTPASLWPPASGGKVGDALYFWEQKQNRFVRVPGAPFSFGTTDFSIDAWVLINQYSGTEIQPIVEKMQYNGTTPVSGYRFYLVSGVLTFDAFGSLSNASTSVGIANQLTQNVWHHVAVTYTRASESVRLYINGTLKTNNVLSTTPGNLSSVSDLIIGGSILGPAINYLGIAIDELEIFNRMLTQPEIQSIWAADSIGKCKPPTSSSYESSCPAASGSDTLYKNKKRRYPDYVNPDSLLNSFASGNPQQGSAQQQQAIIDECKKSCDAQADFWIRTLRRCNISPADSILLREALVDICSKGCSMNTSLGTSTIPLSVMATYHSFEEAIKGILGPGAINDSCTAELLAMPYPYDKQPVLTEMIITETSNSICQRLAQFRADYTGSGFSGSLHQYMQSVYGTAYTLDSTELYDMENACLNCNGILKNDILLPTLFDPQSKPCLRCDSINVALAAFNTKFPVIPVTDDDYENLFANFFNHRFGFALTYDQYKTFLDSCTANNSYTSLLCNGPVSDDAEENDNSCVIELFHTALTNATAIYIAYIDSVHRDFREAWLTKCMNVLPALTMTASLFEYHYTLYYYDQSGNLVKTVPPEGVQFLTAAEIQEVQQKRMTGNNSYCSNNNSMLFGTSTSPGAVVFQNAGNAPELNMGTRPFTIEWFLKLTTFNDQGVLSNNWSFYDGAGGYGERGYAIKIKNGRLVLLMGEGISATSGIVEVQSLPLSGYISLNSWNHFAVERINTGSGVKFYINGNELPVSYLKNNFVTGNIDNNIAIGFYTGLSFTEGTLQFLMSGNLKHLRIYKRAVPHAELRQNYFDYCGNPSNSIAMVFWETFNESVWASGPYTGYSYVYDRVFNAPGIALGSAQSFEFAGGGLVPEHRLATTYQYNSLNQVLQQYSPDGDASVFFYDRLGRLTVSQNKEQKDVASYSGSDNRFSYTKYDALGRINEVGEKSNAVDDIRNINMLDTTAVKDWLGSGTDRQVTKTIYDNPINLYQTATTSRKRVVASIYLEIKTDSKGDSTLYAYDINGNVKKLVQYVKALVLEDPVNGVKDIQYDYDLVSGKVNMVSYQPGKGDQFFYKYLYDADNSVIRSLSSRDKLIWIEDASYNYYLHGPLARTELGQYKVQGVDYAYTLQGWMKGINSNALSPEFEMGQDGWAGTNFERVSRDVYAYGLGYYNQDYEAIGGSGAAAMNQAVYQHPAGADNTGRQLFNGNISHTEVALSKIDNGAAKGYSYGYDQLNRLVFMNQHTISGSTWSNTNIIAAYAESIAYDANGNILKYLRRGANNSPPPGGAGGGPLDMDSMNYKYNRDANNNLVNNRLNHVRDQVNSNNYTTDIDNQQNNNYTYDRIGNLKSDVQEGILYIDWTVYGKIHKLFKQVSSLEPPITIDFGYDPGGNRTTKKVTVMDNTTDITTTFYVRDATGNVLAVYTKVNSAAMKWDEQHLYGSNRLGMWNWDTIVPAAPPVVIGTTPIFDSLLCGSRNYELSNHLGNVLSTISDKKIGHDNGAGVVDYYLAEVLTANDYYPFGAPMPGRSFNPNNYRYGFNGKEKIDEVSGNVYDYGFRIYNPRLGRFLSVDPLMKSYPMLTPYQFASNCPNAFIDLDGLESKLKTVADMNVEAMQKQIKAYSIQAQVKAQVVQALAGDAFDKLPEADKKIAGAKELLTEKISQGINVFVETKEVKAFNGTTTTEVVQITVTPSGYEQKRAQAAATDEKAKTQEKIKDITITVLKTAADIVKIPTPPQDAGDVANLLVSVLGGASKLAGTIGYIFTPTEMGKGDTPNSFPKISGAQLKIGGKGAAYLKNLFNPTPTATSTAPPPEPTVRDKTATNVPAPRSR